jgi:chromosome segregation ATPase
MEFNSKVNGLINQDGKNRAQQYIKNVEKQKKVNADNLEDFKETYARLNRALTELKESDSIDDEEVAYLLRKYNELQSDIYDFNGTIDKEFISQCDEQIEDAINYLKGLYKSLDEIKSSSMGL